jgi:hypothetical protein
VRVRVLASLAVVLLAGGILAVVLSAGAHSSKRSDPSANPLTKWSGGSDPGLHVIPFPGTPDASPSSQIIISSLNPPAIRSIKVVGSESGSHTGALVELPHGAGTEFAPAQPFSARESVRVTAFLHTAREGTAAGAPGSRQLRFSFGVATPVPETTDTPAPKPTSSKTASPKPPPTYPPAEHFRSMPGLGPPIVKATGDPDSASGDIFLTPGNGRQHGPMIVDPRGQLVWFDHITNRLAVYNLEKARYEGQPVLTWWQGKFADAHGIDGRGVIMDPSYRILKMVQAGNGYTSDLHTFQLTPEGTAWIDCYVPVRANLASQGGPRHGTVLDGVVQKIDVRTGRVLWEWHSLAHVPLTASYVRAAGGGPYDYFHLNSIQELPNGKVLISGRNTWAVYKVDERTGRIDWTLGGKHSSFRMRPGAAFEWQHDATLYRGNLLSVFDNAAVPKHEDASSGKLLRINTRSRTAAPVHRYTHTPRIVSLYMGSVQLLSNRSVFVGWGQNANFSEYSPAGRQIFNGQFSGDINSYRAYRFPWHGRPQDRPALALSRDPNGGLQVYSAWNGATEVASWRVLGGADPNALTTTLGQAPRHGFETAQIVHGRPRYVAVEALDAGGKVLGRSAAEQPPLNSR